MTTPRRPKPCWRQGRRLASGFALLLAALLAGPAAAVEPAGSIPTGTLELADDDEPGEPLVVRGRVSDEAGEPIEGAVITVFHTDARGWYTRDEVMDEPHARLRGQVRTGADGRYEVRTIRPGPYPATEDTPENRRIPEHIHFAVSAPGHAPRRFQLVFRDDPRMTPYWHEWARKGGNPIATVETLPDGSQTCVADIAL